MANRLSPPYVVLLGDAGTGKSTILEKMTGESGRSSDANVSYTRTSEVFWVPDGNLIVADTPGSNVSEDKLQHNIWIAAAINFKPVSRIFVVVKAEARMFSVIDSVRKYADCIVELPMDVVAVLVTHMDMVTWTDKDFATKVNKELGIDTVVFSWMDTAGETLEHDILKTCTEAHDLTINSENFFKHFKIHSNHRRILKYTRDEINNFMAKKKAFDEAKKAFSGKDLIDRISEFQTYMTEEIVEAQKRMSDVNNFTFVGDGAANEAGHVANMVNQLRAVLYDIRMECTRFKNEHRPVSTRDIKVLPTAADGFKEELSKKLDAAKKEIKLSSKDLIDRISEFQTYMTEEIVEAQKRMSDVNNFTFVVDGAANEAAHVANMLNHLCAVLYDIRMECTRFKNEHRPVSTRDIKVLPTAADGFKEELSKKLDAAKKEIKLSRASTLMANRLSPPYVVLLGDVGTGKSTVLEKMTGESGRSSDADVSYTRTSEVFWVPDGNLIVADTPGSNVLEDKLQHNIWIAAAINFKPVSRIFIVVKAEARMFCVIDSVRKYADCFVELPMDVVAVLVTHMDMVTWTEKDFATKVNKELGIDTVVFSWMDTAGETLEHDILKTCTEAHDLTINSENFFKHFKIHNNHRRILKYTSDEIKNFMAKKKAFDEAKKAFSGKDLIDRISEFQTYMTEEIVEAQKRMSDVNNFTFVGDGAANEAAHVANMVNQLRAVLYDIRMECTRFKNEHRPVSTRDIKVLPTAADGFKEELSKKLDAAKKEIKLLDKPTSV